MTQQAPERMISSKSVPSKRIVPESSKTRKTREKLQRHWEEIDKQITPEALEQTVDEIHRWISRHAGLREQLTNKRISLFDENQNAAKLSQRVALIAQKLREDMKQLAQAIQPASD